MAKQGVRNVREVEDVLLAALGLVPSLARPGRAASHALDMRAAVRLGTAADPQAGLSWLEAHHARVWRRYAHLSWQPWLGPHPTQWKQLFRHRL